MAMALMNDQEIAICSRGDHWLVSWHAAGAAPEGKNHGAAGICVDGTGEVVMISNDGQSWDFPAGRPDGDENWEQTLCREMLEEACAVVTSARLLGFTRNRRVEGGTIGPPLVRSIWLAHVDMLEWNPQFEIRHRKLVPAKDAIKAALPEYASLWARAFVEARIGQE